MNRFMGPVDDYVTAKYLLQTPKVRTKEEVTGAEPRKERLGPGERETERALLGTIHIGGSRAAPAHGLRMNVTDCFHIHTWRSSSLLGEVFPRSLMRGSPDGTVEPDRHRQEILDLAVWRE